MTALLAALPILLVLGLMVGLGWPATRAGAAGAGLALGIAVVGFGFGTDVLAEVGLAGGLAGVAAEALFTSATILWIILPALAIYHLQVTSGATDVLREALGRLSGDPRILALLIGWFFALFIEGGAGFGSAVALAAPFLVGVGYRPLEAVVIAMIGHSVGVSFGAIGTPIVPMAAATGLDPAVLAPASATYHLVFGWFPLAVIVLLASRSTGTRATGAIWGWAALAGAAFLGPMWLIARFVGPELPTLGGALLGGAIFVGALTATNARRARREDTPAATAATAATALATDRGRLVRAAAPYLVLIGLVLATRTVPAIAEPLGGVVWEWSLAGGFTGSFAPLTHPGTLLATAFLLGAVLQRLPGAMIQQAVTTTLRQLVPITLALVAMLLLARLMVRSEMTAALAEAAAGSAGAVWPLLAPLVGVLGTFVTGSATASNVLFSDLQAATAAELDLPAVPLLGVQNFGAAVGNPIAPHNIVAGGATVGLIGAEADVMRRTLLVTLVYALLGGSLALLLV